MNKILVIDDDEALRRTLEAALHHFGYEVVAASHGEEGLMMAREWMPDVILCDVNMPGMDGRAVLQAMRSDPKLANRQIVLMTGNQAQNTAREGMNLGADDYLPKPFELTQLRTCVKARLRRAEMYRRLEDGMLRRHANLFGSTLPHEFMTPLNGILGFAEILQEDVDKIPAAESRQMLSDIESCARRLHRTLLNYISLVTLEGDANDAPHPPAIPAERSIPVIAAVAQDVARKTGRSADLTAKFDSVEFLCRDDDLRVITEQVVENAFGYSAPGTPVSVGFGLIGGLPTLRVSDQGRGMTPDQIEQIGMFMQFDRKRYEQQGLGIGLALVSRLLKRNEGRFRFESALGRGTTVWVEFRPSS